MMSHLESVRGFITLGYLACEINHFLKLTEKENWSDKSYVPYSVNGVTFSMNYLDAKNQRIIVVNDMVYEGLILKSSEGKPVSEIGDEYVTVINGSTVNRVLILDEEEREEQIVDDALFSGPSSDVESGYYYGTHLVFKGKVTYQEVMGKHEKLLYGVTVEGESFKHPAMINGNPMFLLTYVKASDLGENAKYWEAESEGAYYINNPISSIYNMSTYETRIDAK